MTPQRLGDLQNNILDQKTTQILMGPRIRGYSLNCDQLGALIWQEWISTENYRGYKEESAL